MKRIRVSRAQSVSEYSICAAVIILAIIAMQVYVKRGLQGRYADVADFATSQTQAHSQYEPYYQKEGLELPQDIIEEKILSGEGEVLKVITKDTLTRKGTIEDLTNYNADN